MRRTRQLPESVLGVKKVVPKSVQKTNARKEFTMGIKFFDDGDYINAIKQFKKATQLLPEKAVSWYMLGEALLKSNRFKQAYDSIQMAISLDEEEPSYLFALGDVLRMQRKYDEAVSVYKRALEMAPGDVNILNNLSVAYSSLKKHQEAKSVLLQALALAPSDPELLRNLALSERRLGDRGRSILHSCRAALIDPGMWDLLGGDFYTQGAYREAIIAESVAISRDPHNPDIRQNLGRLLLKMGLIDEAIEEFKLALDLNPNQLSSLLQITQCYLIVKDIVSARIFFSRAEDEAAMRGQSLETERHRFIKDGL